jgi:Ca2+/Na+ antiporter
MVENKKPETRSLILRTLFHVPLFGWLLKDAMLGRPSAAVWFIFNLAAIWILSILFFGYPAIIIPALAAVAIVFVALIIITWGDSLPGR